MEAKYYEILEYGGVGIGRFYDTENEVLVPLADGREISLESMKSNETVSPTVAPSSIGGGGGIGGNETGALPSPTPVVVMPTTPSPTFLTDAPVTASPTGAFAMNSRLLLLRNHHDNANDEWNDSHDPYAKLQYVQEYSEEEEEMTPSTTTTTDEYDDERQRQLTSIIPQRRRRLLTHNEAMAQLQTEYISAQMNPKIFNAIRGKGGITTMIWPSGDATNNDTATHADIETGFTSLRRYYHRHLNARSTETSGRAARIPARNIVVGGNMPSPTRMSARVRRRSSGEMSN